MRAQLIGNGLLTARVAEPFATVLAALQMQGANCEALLARNDAGWQEMLQLCDRRQLTLPLAMRPSKGLPTWVHERLRRNLADTAERFVRVRATYRETSAALDAAGVPHLVLKGFAQAPDYVTAPQFRMQGDIDFYTPKNYARAAFEALVAIGYESAGPDEDYEDADHSPTLIRFREWKWTGNRFDPEMPLALEVHHCLWNAAVSLIELPETEQFWHRRISRKIGGLSFCSLDPVDHLGYFALHILRELLLGRDVLHHALELATFLHLRADDAALWKHWQAQHSERLRRMQAITLALAGAAFSSRMPEAVREQVERLPTEQKRWIEMCGGDLLTSARVRNRDGRLLQWMLADSMAERRKILWRAVSPGVIATPARVAAWLEHPAAVKPRKPRRFWRYPAYLASRVSLNGAAVLRFFVSGLAVLVSSVALRRHAAPQ